MKLTLEQRTELTGLAERASDLLMKIIDERLPKTKTPTKTDLEFQAVLLQIHPICQWLSNSYVLMYNYIQEQKVREQKSSAYSAPTYLKRLTKAKKS